MRKIYVACCILMVLSVSRVFAGDASASDAYFKGVGLAAHGKLEEARSEFQKALSDDTVYPYAKLEIRAIDEVLSGKVKKETALMVFRGKEAATKKKWKEAIDSYTKAIRENPNYPYAFVSRGIAYMSSGNLDKAISNFSEAIDIDPEFTEAYQNRGVLLEFRGQFNKAIKDFNKAVEAEPDSAVLRFNRGMAFFYKQQYDKALPDLNKAIELKPDYAKAYINKAVACETLGMNEEAMEAYRKAIEYDNTPDKEITKDAGESLKALESEMAKEKK